MRVAPSQLGLPTTDNSQLGTDQILISLDILDETPDFVVINKPGDLVCHPTKAGPTSSLIGRLRLHYEGRPEVQPSFVNRLDRETSGIVLIAKHPKAHALLQKQFDARKVQKTYYAIVEGRPGTAEGVIDAPLGRHPTSEVVVQQAVIPEGAASVTTWKLLSQSGNFSLLQVQPRSGRLHQIRVHLASIGHPIVGDKIYGPNPGYYLKFISEGWVPEMEKELRTKRQMLHACGLELMGAEGKALSWSAPCPPDMEEFKLLCGL